MNKKWTITLGLATVAGFAASVVVAGVGGGPHDFTSEAWNSSGEKCLPCHIPHGAQTQIAGETVAFLWNHEVPDASAFTVHSGAQLGPESLVCLGCHDGQTALDSFGGVTGTTVMTGTEVIGTDLMDDHAVGVEYGTSTRRAAVGTIWGGQPAVVVGFGGLPLFGTDNKIECATCHTPHDVGTGNFLRVNNAASGLCVACHTAHE